MVEESSIKRQVFDLLDKNPSIKPKQVCRLLHLNYNYYKNYIYQLKHKWKNLPRNERGSIRSIHGWRGLTYIPREYYDDKRHEALRLKAVNSGWIQSKSRNRFLYYKDRIGRLQWFETGRVNIYVRKPLTTARAYQLVCNAFGHLDLITDLKVLQLMLKNIKFKRAHYVFDTPQRLPQMSIDLFGKSNGIIIKIGDSSHPHAVEVIASYPDWAERNEKLFDSLDQFFERFFNTIPVNNKERKPTWYIQ